MLFRIVGRVGCEGHPVTLIPSQTWRVECKYELFFKPKLTLIFSLRLRACVFMYKCHLNLKESSKQTGTAAPVFGY